MKYQDRKEIARAEAITYTYSDEAYSYGELADIQEYFRKMARRYGLTREFAENGII